MTQAAPAEFCRNPGVLLLMPSVGFGATGPAPKVTLMALAAVDRGRDFRLAFAGGGKGTGIQPSLDRNTLILLDSTGLLNGGKATVLGAEMID